MADGDWNRIIAEYKTTREFYSKIDNTQWAKEFIRMEKLIPHLLSNRDLSELYPITSHHALSLFIGKTWSEHLGKPYISIKLNWTIKEELRDKYRYEFSLTQHKDEGAICRKYVESVFCSFEKSLEVFDELFKKLKESHK